MQTHDSVESNGIKPKHDVPAPKKGSLSKSNKVIHDLKPALYRSMNLYNMHPEPVVLSSDEEEDVIPQSMNNRANKTNTRSSQASQSKVIKKSNGLKRKVCKDTETDSTKEQDLRSNGKLVKMDSATVKKTVLNTRARKALENINNNQKPVTQKNSKTTVKNYEFDEIDSLFNLNSQDEEEEIDVCKSPEKQNSVKHDIKQDSVELLNTPSLEVKEKSVNISCYAEVLNGKDISYKRVLNPKTVEPKATNSSAESNRFSKDHVTKFEEVLFKPNRKCGGIIARGLHTSNNDFGFVEIVKDETFHGSCPKITFVVLEGEATFIQGTKSDTLVPGDMLHIKKDQPYQIQNKCRRNSRLMYVKEL